MFEVKNAWLYTSIPQYVFIISIVLSVHNYLDQQIQLFKICTHDLLTSSGVHIVYSLKFCPNSIFESGI